MPTGIRDEYYKFFNKNGVKYPAAGNLSKPTIGRLSPGCRTCIEGTWSCIFINSVCTKHCFYCPAPQNDRNKQPVVPENLSFASAQDYIEYLKKFDFKGIAFSGGEPLLALDTLLEYMNEVKQCFGDTHYIWAYTNGDLVTGQNLSLLKKAGLNELRFDIIANNYDLTVVEKAVEYIDTVSVEIPAIPEDMDNLKSILKELEKIGVKYLNLHQLMKTEHNSENLNQRGYSLVNEKLYPDQTPIMESELAALEILKHALEMKSDLGIQYCSRCYKARFQGMAHRKRAALFCKDKKPDLTKTGYLRKVAINASTEEAAFIKSHVHETEWELTVEGESSKLVFPLHYFNVLLTENYHQAEVIYYEPHLAPTNNKTTVEESTEMVGGNNICFHKKEKIRTTLDNITSAFLFYKLFIEKINIELVKKELLNVYGSNDDSVGKILHDIKEFNDRFQEVEYLPPDLEPYD
ncbi:radical SAM protein [candidate division CSSED10-310 bacterium]|uniref:Radical SAM protein n=1 Tax=candidate division CSSED10-310 bacterium TaxID=2855610 RepID=A0ABV6YU97_UNCC1